MTMNIMTTTELLQVAIAAISCAIGIFVTAMGSTHTKTAQNRLYVAKFPKSQTEAERNYVSTVRRNRGIWINIILSPWNAFLDGKIGKYYLQSSFFCKSCGCNDIWLIYLFHPSALYANSRNKTSNKIIIKPVINVFAVRCQMTITIVCSMVTIGKSLMTTIST